MNRTSNLIASTPPHNIESKLIDFISKGPSENNNFFRSNNQVMNIIIILFKRIFVIIFMPILFLLLSLNFALADCQNSYDQYLENAAKFNSAYLNSVFADGSEKIPEARTRDINRNFIFALNKAIVNCGISENGANKYYETREKFSALLTVGGLIARNNLETFFSFGKFLLIEEKNILNTVGVYLKLEDKSSAGRELNLTFDKLFEELRLDIIMHYSPKSP